MVQKPACAGSRPIWSMIWQGALDQKIKPAFAEALNPPYFLTNFNDGGV